MPRAIYHTTPTPPVSQQDEWSTPTPTVVQVAQEQMRQDRPIPEGYRPTPTPTTPVYAEW